MKKHIALWLVSALLLAAAPAHSQMVRGVVAADTVGRLLEGAQLILEDDKGTVLDGPVRTDSLGLFALRTRNPGTYILKAMLIGYEPLSARVELGLKAVVNVRVILSNSPLTTLGAVTVVERRSLNDAELMSTEGFEYRRRRGTGIFFDSLDIKKAGYPQFSTAVKMFAPGIDTEFGFAGNEVLTMQVAGGKCQPVIFRDAIKQQPMALTLINGMRGQEFYGVEVYRRPNIPREFQHTGSECGVIAVWTKWLARNVKRD